MGPCGRFVADWAVADVGGVAVASGRWAEAIASEACARSTRGGAHYQSSRVALHLLPFTLQSQLPLSCHLPEAGMHGILTRVRNGEVAQERGQHIPASAGSDLILDHGRPVRWSTGVQQSNETTSTCTGTGTCKCLANTGERGAGRPSGGSVSGLSLGFR